MRDSVEMRKIAWIVMNAVGIRVKIANFLKKFPTSNFDFNSLFSQLKRFFTDRVAENAVIWGNPKKFKNFFYSNKIFKLIIRFQNFLNISWISLVALESLK